MTQTRIPACYIQKPLCIPLGLASPPRRSLLRLSIDRRHGWLKKLHDFVFYEKNPAQCSPEVFAPAARGFGHDRDSARGTQFDPVAFSGPQLIEGASPAGRPNPFSSGQLRIVGIVPEAAQSSFSKSGHRVAGAVDRRLPPSSSSEQPSEGNCFSPNTRRNSHRRGSQRVAFFDVFIAELHDPGIDKPGRQPR